MSEYEHEPVPGLPERLPAGETMLWQGTPDWVALLRRALHGTAAATYLGVFAAWALASGLHDGQTSGEAAAAAARIVLVGSIGIAVLAGLALLMARMTIFTITDRRVVMRFGVALPMAINIPFSRIKSADVKLHGDGTGDIALTTTGEVRLGYVPLWPYARAWRLSNPEPLLRAIPDGQKVAELLAGVLATAHGLAPKTVGAPSAAPSDTYRPEARGTAAVAA